jgi:competence protein ComEA
MNKVCSILAVVLTLTFLAGGVAFSAQTEQAVVVNINSADVKEIMKLPGVGKKKAEAIISYRDENGRFDNVDDLRKVDGIGKKSLERIRGLIVVK